MRNHYKIRNNIYGSLNHLKNIFMILGGTSAWSTDTTHEHDNAIVSKKGKKQTSCSYIQLQNDNNFLRSNQGRHCQWQ